MRRLEDENYGVIEHHPPNFLAGKLSDDLRIVTKFDEAESFGLGRKRGKFLAWEIFITFFEGGLKKLYDI